MQAKMLCKTFVVAILVLAFVCAARAQDAEKNLNFRGLYSKHLQGLADGLTTTATGELAERDDAKKCWPGFSPEKNDHLSTCCWYGAQTCCKSNVAGYVLHDVAKQLEAVHKNGTNDKCYVAVADLLCLWCSPDTARFVEGDMFISVSVCMSVCNKLWDACHDQQDTFGISPKALTARQLCNALLVEEEDEETPQGGVNVVIAPESSTKCFGGAALSVVENSNCLPHISRSSSSGPSGGSIAAMVLVPFLVIGITVVAVIAYFQVRRRRENQALYLGGGGGGGDDEFSIPADAFGEEGGFLDEEGDLGGSHAPSGLLNDDEEDSKFSVQ